jgi:carbon storage regulator
MLILSRKSEQSLKIGAYITITVLAVDGDRIKLGIDAPAHISVLRQELFEQIQASNSAAGASSLDPRRIAALLHARSGERHAQ